MACKNCHARSRMLQDSVLEMKLAAAVGHAVKGAAEMVGLKEKTGAAELAAQDVGPEPHESFASDEPDEAEAPDDFDAEDDEDD